MMVIIPLYIILFIYFLFLIVFTFFSILNFYHIIITGSFTMASFIASFFIFVLTVLTLYFTWQLLLPIDWKITLLEINAGLWSGSNTTF